MLNLALALIWFVAAAVLFFGFDHGQPGNTFLPLPWSGVALIMGLYNVARWWFSRRDRAGRRHPDQLWQERRQMLRRPGDERAPDPTFQFTDRPPEAAPRQDKPPGDNGITAPPGSPSG